MNGLRPTFFPFAFPGGILRSERRHSRAEGRVHDEVSKVPR
jgi:hypothetical protein